MSKIILITGSNRGLGKATGIELCKKGHTVIFTYRNIKNLDQVKKETKNYNADFYELDVLDINSIKKLKLNLEKKYQHIDTLINNAGILNDRNDSLLELNSKLLHETMNTNLFSPINMIQEFHGLLKKSKNAVIVNISSVLGQLDSMTTGMPSYRISKCSINAVTKIFSEEFKKDNIKVNSIHPGWVQTDMGGENASLTIEEAVPALVWAATLEQDGPSGKFFFNKKEIPW